MPLLKSSSKKALKKNIATEIEAHPDKKDRAQDLAIAFSVQRRNRKPKMASGGSVPDPKASPAPKPEDDSALATGMKSISDAFKFKGGMIDSMDEDEDMQDLSMMSVSDRIRHKMAMGGMVEHDDGEADVMSNGAPQPRIFDERNHEMMDENYDQDIMDASYPSESEMSKEENESLLKENTVANRIRMKMKSKRM